MGFLLGAHVSIADSIDKAVDRADELGCTTFQIFTRNPRGWKFSPLDKVEIDAFRSKVVKSKYSAFAAHMPYLPNIASPVDEAFNKSVDTLAAELERCGQLGIPYLVTHLGSHLGSGLEAGIKRVTRACNEALSKSETKTVLLLENTAGTKNSVGSLFEHLRAILNGISKTHRVGVCFDTCHAFASGYDLRNSKKLEDVIEAFDTAVGLEMLKLVHLNDSKGDLGCQRDRHEHIGLGYIGTAGFKVILSNSIFRKLPLVLETPQDGKGDYTRDLQEVRKLA